MNFNEVQDKINDIFQELSSLKHQTGRLVSDAESEKETRARINKGLSQDIIKLENELKDLLYGKDRKSGIVVELDRLNQENMQRQKMKQNIFALWIAIGGIIVKEILTFVMKK